MKEKIRVMFYDDGINSTTGYARVAKELTTELAKDEDFEVYNINITDRNPATVIDGVNSLPIYGDRREPMKSGYISSVINSLIMIQPHVFIPICDAFLMERDGLAKIKFNKIKLMPYIPLDSNNLPVGSKDILNKADRVLVQSEFAKTQLKKYKIHSHVFRHGVKFDRFKQDKEAYIESRKELKIEDDEIAFLFIGRNTKRKRLPRLLRGYAQFIQENPDVKTKLILHGSDFDEYVFHIPRLIEELEFQFGINIKNKIIFPYENHQLGKGVSDEDIELLYYASDWTISMSGGEGTGLMSLEGFANNKPTIYPCNSNYEEILGNYIDETIGLRERGFEVKSGENVFVGLNCEQPQPSYIDLVTVLKNACEITKTDLYNNLSDNAYSWIQENGDWKKIANELKVHIKEVIKHE